MVFDPGDATGNTIVCWARPVLVVGDGGIFRTTTAQTTATFTQTLAVTQAANTRGELDAVRIGGVTTMYLASGEVPAGGRRTELDGSQAPYVTLWSDGHDFICVEPCWGLPDAHEQVPFEQKAGIQTIVYDEDLPYVPEIEAVYQALVQRAALTLRRPLFSPQVQSTNA